MPWSHAIAFIGFTVVSATTSVPPALAGEESPNCAECQAHSLPEAVTDLPDCAKLTDRESFKRTKCEYRVFSELKSGKLPFEQALQNLADCKPPSQAASAEKASAPKPSAAS